VFSGHPIFNHCRSRSRAIHTYEYASVRVSWRWHTSTTGNISRHIVAICTRNPARARQNARRRRDARFYLSAIYLPTRALPKRSPAHDPAGDRFEKLLIVLFWKGVPRSPPLPPSATRSAEESSFYASCWLTRRRWHIGSTRANVPPFDRLEGVPSRRCESMGGDRCTKSRNRVNSFVEQRNRLRRNIYIPTAVTLDRVVRKIPTFFANSKFISM